MKINIDEPAGADKTSSAPQATFYWSESMERAIEDLLFIQNDKKMYINEKKQIQSLIYKLYELDFYVHNETALDQLGYTLIK